MDLTSVLEGHHYIIIKGNPILTLIFEAHRDGRGFSITVSPAIGPQISQSLMVHLNSLLCSHDHPLCVQAVKEECTSGSSIELRNNNRVLMIPLVKVNQNQLCCIWYGHHPKGGSRRWPWSKWLPYLAPLAASGCNCCPGPRPKWPCNKEDSDAKVSLKLWQQQLWR